MTRRQRNGMIAQLIRAEEFDTLRLGRRVAAESGTLL